MTHRSAPATEPGALLAELRRRGPLVHSITNAVVTGFTANALLALGAAAAMVDIPGEAGPFARVADGLLINLGTPTAEQREAVREAASAAGEADTEWVLDPVAVGSLPVRTALAAEVVALRPTAIRGNASEVLALAGAGDGGRGVDATDAPERALAAAGAFAREIGSIVAVSGQEDLITDGADVVRVSNGHPLLTRVTGGGCALGAVVAAFLAVRGDTSPLHAVAAAHAAWGVAAERAAARAAGPGTFAVGLLDELASLTEESLAESARLTVSPLDGGAAS
ncbi:MAG: hydroxyethylthiazole kinase [Microbacterium sp.]